jgi:hypothetical protein
MYLIVVYYITLKEMLIYRYNYFIFNIMLKKNVKLKHKNDNRFLFIIN